MVRVTRMKTTIELPDELLEQSGALSGVKARLSAALVEEGLQRSLEARRNAVHRDLDFPTYGGSGLTAEFQGASWNRIRDELYGEHGA